MVLAEQEDIELLEKNYWKNRGKNLLKEWRLYAMLLPLALVLLFWRYMPIAGMIVGFKNYNPALGTLGSQFIGLHWFDALLFGNMSADFWRAFRNTFVVSFYGLCFGFPFPIILALFFSEIKNSAYRSIVQIFSYLPKFVSLVVVTSLVLLLLQPATDYSKAGPLAAILEKLGATRIMYNPKYFRAVYQISGIWETAGYGSIVYFAAIMGISPTSYEAARIDGASKMQQIRYVTIPGMTATLTIMLILDIGKLLTVGYEKVILLYNNDLYQTADIISTYVYRLGLTGANKAAASAADFFNSVIAMFLVIGSNQIARRVSSTSLY